MQGAERRMQRGGGSREGEGGAGAVLGGGFDLEVGNARGVEATADGLEGEVGTIAVAAQVSEVEVAEAGSDDLLGEVGGIGVREVAVAADDALFDAPGAAGVVLEEFQVVVGFKNEGVGGTNTLDDQAGGMTEVGQEPDVARRRAQEEPDGVLGVMRNGESLDLDIADFERGAGGEEAELEWRAGSGGGDGVAGQAVAVDRQAEFGAEDRQTLGMVAVFVGDEDAVERLRFARTGEGGEALADLAGAEAGIDEQAG